MPVGADSRRVRTRVMRAVADISENYCTDECKSCRDVVLRTYCGFRECGGDDPSAFKTAVQVLCLRHPERTKQENTELASVWIAQALEFGKARLS